MDDDLISIADAAKRVGLNKSTLARQVKGGAIRSHGGRVRLSEVLEDRAANIDLAKGHRKERPLDGAEPPVDADDGLVMVDGQLLTTAEAIRLKENYLGKLRQLEFETKSGRMVDVALVETRAFALSRQDRDALTNWPARVSPLIAAEVGADQVALTVALEKHVREFLTERSDPELRLRLAGGQDNSGMVRRAQA